MIFRDLRLRFFLISWFNCKQYGKNHYKKKEHNQHSSVFNYLNFKDPLIIPLIFNCFILS